MKCLFIYVYVRIVTRWKPWEVDSLFRQKRNVKKIIFNILKVLEYAVVVEYAVKNNLNLHTPVLFQTMTSKGNT